jgi:hypothetical protein
MIMLEYEGFAETKIPRHDLYEAPLAFHIAVTPNLGYSDKGSGAAYTVGDISELRVVGSQRLSQVEYGVADTAFPRRTTWS